jgi:hypothetical protein
MCQCFTRTHGSRLVGYDWLRINGYNHILGIAAAVGRKYVFICDRYRGRGPVAKCLADAVGTRDRSCRGDPGNGKPCSS